QPGGLICLRCRDAGVISVAVKALKPKPLIPNRLAGFEELRRQGKHVFLYGFDLLELDGPRLPPAPPEKPHATPASLLYGSLPGEAGSRAGSECRKIAPVTRRRLSRCGDIPRFRLDCLEKRQSGAAWLC